MHVARKAFRACLIISAVRRPTTTLGPSIPARSFSTAPATAASSEPMTVISGFMNRSMAWPSFRFSGTQAMPKSREGRPRRMAASIRSQVPTGTWLLTTTVAPLSKCFAKTEAAAITCDRSDSSRSSTFVS